MFQPVLIAGQVIVGLLSFSGAKIHVLANERDQTFRYHRPVKIHFVFGICSLRDGNLQSCNDFLIINVCCFDIPFTIFPKILTQ